MYQKLAIFGDKSVKAEIWTSLRVKVVRKRNLTSSICFHFKVCCRVGAYK